MLVRYQQNSKLNQSITIKMKTMNLDLEKNIYEWIENFL